MTVHYYKFSKELEDIYSSHELSKILMQHLKFRAEEQLIGDPTEVKLPGKFVNREARKSHSSAVSCHQAVCC